MHKNLTKAAEMGLFIKNICTKVFVAGLIHIINSVQLNKEVQIRAAFYQKTIMASFKQLILNHNARVHATQN